MASKSVTRFGSLRSIFPTDILHADIARLIVLSEDLKIELRGVQTVSIPPLDMTNEAAYRERYFLRRSIGTLVELGEAFHLVNSRVGIDGVLNSFTKEATEHWSRTVEFFDQHRGFFRKVRNDMGGHFGTQAAKYAVETFKERTIGKLELKTDYKTGTRIFIPHFVGEITARAFVRSLEGDTVEDCYRDLMQRTVDAYRLAARSVTHLINFYIWDRFGR